MSEPVIDIERVVREVLAELNAAQKGEGGRGKAEGNDKRETRNAEVSRQNSEFGVQNPPPSPFRLPPSASSAPSDGDLHVTSRVVTMTEIFGRLAGARRVVVSREAVVTPAVRDELLRRGIALQYADSANGHSARPVRLVMILVRTDFDPVALLAGLAREELKVESSALDCLIAATNQLATEVAQPDTLGVLLTRHAAAGLCLANRLGGVRAITGADAPAVASAAAAVGANLLVADPQTGTFFQLKQMVTEFCRGGVRPCPAAFRAKLA